MRLSRRPREAAIKPWIIGQLLHVGAVGVHDVEVIVTVAKARASVVRPAGRPRQPGKVRRDSPGRL